MRQIEGGPKGIFIVTTDNLMWCSKHFTEVNMSKCLWILRQQHKYSDSVLYLVFRNTIFEGNLHIIKND